MTAEQLFNDRTFFTLLTDVWKARKDAGMGPIRLQVLLDYLARVSKPIAKPSAFPALSGNAQSISTTEPPEIDMSLPENQIKRDEVALEKESAGPVERMIKAVIEAGEKAQGRPFTLRFNKSEGQAVQEIGVYLERLNVPYRLAADPYGNEKGFDGSNWVLNFVKR